MHHLSAAEETKMLSDQTAKVQFEIRNMFKVINRLTTNEITIFSPILTLCQTVLFCKKQCRFRKRMAH